LLHKRKNIPRLELAYEFSAKVTQQFQWVRQKPKYDLMVIAPQTNKIIIFRVK